VELFHRGFYYFLFILYFPPVGTAINNYEQGRCSETENSTLRGIFGPKREEGVGTPENCIMIGFLIGTLHRTGDYVKVRWVKTRDTNGRNEKRTHVYCKINKYMYTYGRIILNWNKVLAVSIEFICFDRGLATGFVSMLLKLPVE